MRLCDAIVGMISRAFADDIEVEMVLQIAADFGSVGVRGVAVALADAPEEQWFAHVLPLTSGRRQEAGHNHNAVAAVFIRRTAPNSSNSGN